MAIPNLDDWTERLDVNCRDYLGEAISYKAVGASAYATKRGHVDYRDGARDFGGSQVIEQDITVSLMKADVPARPTGACRLQLARRVGKTFSPIGVRSDESGTHWEFEVQQVSA